MKSVTYLLLSIFLISCGRNENSRVLKEFIGSRVMIPTLETAVFDGRDTTMSISGYETADAKMIIFYDSTVCSSCKMSQIWNWEKVVATSKALRGRFVPVFVFAPGYGNVGQLKVSLKTYPFEWPAFIDERGEFLRRNPDFPAIGDKPFKKVLQHIPPPQAAAPPTMRSS